jgi:hypothetical protein
MSDDAIANALSKRADLESRIVKAEEVIKRSKAQILEINRFIKQWEKFSGRAADDIQPAKSLPYDADFSRSQPTAEAAGNPKKETVAEAAIHILEKVGKPMSRAELYTALQADGVRIQGANPEMVLSTMLWRTRDAFGIHRLKSGGYALQSMIEEQDQIDTDDLLG